MAAFWQLTYGGLTQGAATWGVSHLKRVRKTGAPGTVTFRVDGMPFDSALPFAWRQPLSILRNGQPWFSGWVTKPEPKGNAKAEAINYEIADAWYILEKTAFQQQWVTTDTSGGALETMTTTRSDVILGQSLAGVKMNSGQVMMEVLLYAQYAYQMQPFPTMVDVNNLPPAPDPANGPLPFLIGALTPSIVVPYAQTKNKSCADILRQLMKFSPDAVAWMDYSTSPATLNIDKRANLQKKTISVLGGLVVNEFNPTPRYDLQVPVVVVKFEQKNSIDGVSYDDLFVDVYPPAPPGVKADAWASQPFAWVQTVDLVGGHTTMQTAPFTVRARPVSLADPLLPGWFLRKEAWLTQQVDGVNLYDTANIQFAFFGPGNYVPATNTFQYLDPDDPLLATNPVPAAVKDGFNLDCHTLVNELITGKVADWLYASDGILAGKILIEVWASYAGTQPNTAALFTFDPSNPAVPTAPGAGYMVRWYGLTVTNASTTTYSELTSWAAAEGVPVGFAQQLYEAIAQLHFDGNIVLVEQECSDLLPPGSTFNATDGNPDWQAMDALVLSVEEDVDQGMTSVHFGPPAFLSLSEMEELFRAMEGLLPSFKLTQRTTGVITAGANVDDGKHMSHSTASGPPTPATAPAPWAVSIKKIGGTYVALVNPGILMKSQVQGDIVVVENLSPTTLAIQQSAGSTDYIYLEVPVANGAPSGDGTVNSGSAGGTFDPSLAAWDASGKAYLANDGATPPNQTFFRVLLATIATGKAVNGVTPAPVPTACCATHLLIFATAANGEAAIIAWPTNTAS